MDTETKRQITKYYILKPLHEALKELDITELSVLKVFKSVLDNPDARDADKLKASDMFIKWMGLTDHVDLSVDTDIKEALDELTARREARIKGEFDDI